MCLEVKEKVDLGEGMNFEEIIRRYKKVQEELTVLKNKSVSLEKQMSQFPSELLEKSEQELLSICEEKLRELEDSSESAQEIFEKIESLRTSYGF